MVGCWVLFSIRRTNHHGTGSAHPCLHLNAFLLLCSQLTGWKWGNRRGIREKGGSLSLRRRRSASERRLDSPLCPTKDEAQHWWLLQPIWAVPTDHISWGYRLLQPMANSWKVSKISVSLLTGQGPNFRLEEELVEGLAEVLIFALGFQWLVGSRLCELLFFRCRRP